jgi:hypothetical protein
LATYTPLTSTTAAAADPAWVRIAVAEAATPTMSATTDVLKRRNLMAVSASVVFVQWAMD